VNARSLIDDTGLRFSAAFARDPLLLAALAAAPLGLMALSLLYPGWAQGIRLDWPLVLAAVLWQPCIEELLFRGIIQGSLGGTDWGRRQLAGFSHANLATSILFALTHLVHQPPGWAAAVLGPSLVFGYFRERHGHIYACVVLHAAYNGTFLGAAALLAGA
jgi:membrane protease YdiL (CAAX protease family)